MREVGIDVDRQAVQRHPLLHTDADGGDLVLVAVALVGPAHPDADAVFAPLAAHVEGGQRADDPFLQRGDEAAHVRPAPPEVEHDVGHTLAGSVIGELAAAAGLVDGEAGGKHVLRLGAGAGGIKRWVLDEPDQLGGRARGNRGDPLVHDGQGVRIGDWAVAHAPFHRRQLGGQPKGQFVARVNHSFTIP